MTADQITLLLGVDAVTLEQLRHSHNTWLKFHPELWAMPWHVYYDPRAVKPSDLDFLEHKDLRTRKWKTEGYPSQRAAMLTGFLFEPIHISTFWWMKLDTDAIALDGDTPLWEPEWFTPTESGEYNCWVANPWGYSKAKGDDRSMAEWAESLEAWGDGFSNRPRLDMASRIDGRRLSMPRMASWMSFYRTEWTKQMALSFLSTGPPVPSQDTCAWYFAERRGDRCRKVRFKRRGWTNVPKLDKLKAKVHEVMRWR
jgi:hypothetical protein